MRRRVLVAVAVVAVALGVGYLGAYAAAGPGIARGTTVLGVAIGGLSRDEAVTVLRTELAKEARKAFAVRVGEVTVRVPPTRAGLSIDEAATVDAAQARSWSPLELADALVGADRVRPVVSVDRQALITAVERVADQVDRDAVDGDVQFTQAGQVQAVEPVTGVRLDQARARTALVEGYLTRRHLRGASVDLPAQLTEPAIDDAEVDRVILEVAGPAVSAPVDVTVEGTTVQLPPTAIARSLTFEPGVTDQLEPRLDGSRLHTAVAEPLAAVEQPATDASFDVSGSRPQVIPSRQGREVLPESLALAVLPVLTETGPARTAAVRLERSAPEVTTSTARSLGVRELVSSFTTYYPSDFPPRLTNIHRAAELMDDTLVLPGETFSFNETVGERTPERGFAAGFIIDNGRLEVDFGGGVSQLVTTVFNAAFFAGLEVVEHNPHSFYISRYPEGRESTIAWGVKDLRIRNDSENGVFLTTSYTNSSVTVRVWGTKRFRIESTKSPRYDITPFRVEYDPRPPGVEQGDCVATEGVPGFRVVVMRLFYVGGQQVRSEEFRTTYAPENEVLCGVSGPSP